MIYNYSFDGDTDIDFEQIMQNLKIEFSTGKITLMLSHDKLPKRRGKESIKHLAMKKAMVEYLKKLGEPEPKLEYGYLDVYAPTLGIIVECGDTPLRRIIDNIKHREDIKELWTIDINCAKNNEYEIIKFWNKK